MDVDRVRRNAAAVLAACRLIEESTSPPSLDDLGRQAGFSPFHFHRVFKGFTGVTPHAYLTARRAIRVRRELVHAHRVSDAIYSSGFNSDGHFYSASADMLGMTPSEFRAGGAGVSIRFATGVSSLGAVLVGVTDKGVCAMLVGQHGDALTAELGTLFPRAELVSADPALTAMIRDALALAELPALGRQHLPTDVSAVALGARVRQALRDLVDDWAA